MIDVLRSMNLSHPREQQREFVLGQELRVSILTTREETGGRHDFTDSWQAPNNATPLHVHTKYDERFWVAAGELTVWAGSDVVTLGPGDYIAVPMNTPHAIQAGPDGARALQISSPAAFAELIERTGTPIDKATTATELDLDLFMQVTTELGDEVLGPPGTIPADIPMQQP